MTNADKAEKVNLLKTVARLFDASVRNRDLESRRKIATAAKKRWAADRNKAKV